LLLRSAEVKPLFHRFVLFEHFSLLGWDSSFAAKGTLAYHCKSTTPVLYIYK